MVTATTAFLLVSTLASSAAFPSLRDAAAAAAAKARLPPPLDSAARTAARTLPAFTGIGAFSLSVFGGHSKFLTLPVRSGFHWSRPLSETVLESSIPFSFFCSCGLLGTASSSLVLFLLSFSLLVDDFAFFVVAFPFLDFDDSFFDFDEALVVFFQNNEPKKIS